MNICLATKLLSAVGITTRMTIKGELPQFMVRELLVKTVSLQSGGKNGNMTINEESLLCMKDTCLILGLLTKPTTNGGRRGNTKEGKISKFHKTHDILFPDGKETNGWWTTYGKIHDSITHDEDGTKTSSWDWHWPDTEPPRPPEPPNPDELEPVRPLINIRDITHRDEQEQITGGLRFNYSYDINSNMVNVRRTALTRVTVPEVLDVSPVEGPVGQRVEVHGRNLLGFSGIASVTFNGSPAEIVTASKELLLVEVPAGATNGPIGIRTDLGTDGLASDFCIPQC